MSDLQEGQGMNAAKKKWFWSGMLRRKDFFLGDIRD
jgi:hypothetical protein